LSGGVDSAVAALLVHKAVGDQLTCVFVDHGLLRENEAEQVVETFGGHFHVPLVHVEAQERFLSRLTGVEDPEEKRKIVGEEFIRVFEQEARQLSLPARPGSAGADPGRAKTLGDVRFLVQGTLYSDAILQEEIRRAGLYRELWQSFAVLPAVKSVGVQGDGRTYAYPIVIRAVTSEDAMTADWARLPYEVLDAISSRIVNEVAGVNRV